MMAALPNIGGALCSTRKVWLMPTSRVPCSQSANIERKTRTQREFCTLHQPKRRPNIVQFCRRLTSVEQCRCSNEAKTRNLLKFARVPQTGKPISAANGSKFTILWEHVEEILLFNKFFFRLSMQCRHRYILRCRYAITAPHPEYHPYTGRLKMT